MINSFQKNLPVSFCEETIKDGNISNIKQTVIILKVQAYTEQLLPLQLTKECVKAVYKILNTI